MINKQNLWFITLFSLILVLGIYYFSLNDETKQVLSDTNRVEPTISITEVDSLQALRVAQDEEVVAQIEDYQNTILDSTKSMEEKNLAYENMQVISKQKSKAEELEKLINDKFNLKSFVKFNQDQINVVISKKDHNAELANNIIRAIQELYTEQMYITVKFQ